MTEPYDRFVFSFDLLEAVWVPTAEILIVYVWFFFFFLSDLDWILLHDVICQ